MSSNPDTKSYLGKDVFTYISYTVNKESIPEDTAQFRITEMKVGDTGYYSKGMFILDKVVSNPDNGKYHFKPTDKALMASISIIHKDSMRYSAFPLVYVDDYNYFNQVDDTVYAPNLYVRFMGVADSVRVKIAIKESDRITEYVTLKAYIFPQINLVWLGIIIMAIGMVMSAVQRVGAKRLVIDSLAGFERALAPDFREDFEESLYRMFVSLTGHGVTILSTLMLEESFVKPPASNYAISFLTDDIIRLRYVEIDGQLRKILMVVKMRGGQHSKEIREYDITHKGIELSNTPLKGYKGLTTGVPGRSSHSEPLAP